jgi:hypothetical protein
MRSMTDEGGRAKRDVIAGMNATGEHGAAMTPEIPRSVLKRLAREQRANNVQSEAIIWRAVGGRRRGYVAMRLSHWRARMPRCSAASKGGCSPLRSRRQEAALLTRPARRGLGEGSGRRASRIAALRAGSTRLRRVEQRAGSSLMNSRAADTEPPSASFDILLVSRTASVIASEAKQSIRRMDCFVAALLAMTVPLEGKAPFVSRTSALCSTRRRRGRIFLGRPSSRPLQKAAARRVSQKRRLLAAGAEPRAACPRKRAWRAPTF